MNLQIEDIRYAINQKYMPKRSWVLILLKEVDRLTQLCKEQKREVDWLNNLKIVVEYKKEMARVTTSEQREKGLKDALEKIEDLYDNPLGCVVDGAEMGQIAKAALAAASEVR